MKLRNHNIKAKRIKIVFDNSSEDYWEAASEGGIELDEAMRLITRAYEKCEPSKEPLIKDENVREAVRAWAKANNINSNYYYETDVIFDSVEYCFTWIDTSIQFNEITGLENLEHGKKYTVDELCGEGEG